MPAEVFNPNPIVFSPIKSLGRRSELLAQSLWIGEPTSSDDEADDLELIDQDEVFGEFDIRCRSVLKHSLMH
jgi:hypothetical protein